MKKSGKMTLYSYCIENIYLHTLSLVYKLARIEKIKK